MVLTFKTTAVPYFYYVADQIDVLPQHIWASIKNPVTYADASPVGTGPYTVSQCSGQNITYTANPNYWQPGLPKVKTIEYPAFTSNDPANEELATGVAQLGAQFIPNIKAFYTSKSPNYHYWFPPIANVSMFINLTVAPLNDLAVREAIAYGVDRAACLCYRRVRLRASLQPGRHRHAHLQFLAGHLPIVQVQLQLQPGQGDIGAGERRVQEGLGRHLRQERQGALLHASSMWEVTPTGWQRYR